MYTYIYILDNCCLPFSIKYCIASSMPVIAVSGTAVAELQEDERCLPWWTVEVHLGTWFLADQVGHSRVWQSLVKPRNRRPLQDDRCLRPLSGAQLAIKICCAPDEIADKELFHACEEYTVRKIEQLLRKPQDPNGRGAANQHTDLAPFHMAAYEVPLEVVHLLLEVGADKDTAREDGATARYAFASSPGGLCLASGFMCP